MQWVCQFTEYALIRVFGLDFDHDDISEEFDGQGHETDRFWMTCLMRGH